MTVHEPELQAILALCHHEPMQHHCQQCQYRAATAVEHITVVCKQAIESLEGRP